MTDLDVLFPLSLSNSSLGDFWSCELKGFRGQIQKLVGAGTSPDLLAGSAFASACEIARKAFYEEEISQEEAIELGQTFILKSPDTGHPIKTNERVALSFKKYIEAFPFSREFQPCQLEGGSYAIEYRFELDTGIPHPDLPDRNILFTGLLDGLYEQRVHGEVINRYVLDEKTTARVSRVRGTKVVDLEKEADLFRASGQLIGYAFAAQQLGIDITAGLIRRVPMLTTHEPAFELELPITKFMKDRWAEATFEKIKELKDRYVYYRDNVKGVEGAYPHSVFYPSYSTSCTAYNRKCQFMEGCLHKRGESILAATHSQLVKAMDKEGNRLLIPLDEYKQKLGL